MKGNATPLAVSAPASAAADERPSEVTRDPRRSLIRAANVGLALAGAVGSFAWAAVYSRWDDGLFAVPLLGLGVADWLAARLPDGRRRYAEVLDDVLSHPLTLGVLLLVLGGGLAAGELFGGVQVVSSQPASAPARSVWLETGDRLEAPMDLPVGGFVRRPLRTTWWRPAEVAVRVSRAEDQLGEQVVRLRVRPHQRPTLAVAERFSRPVLLLRPSTRLLDFLSIGETRILVAHAGVEKSVPWHGELILVGCPADRVCVPAAGAESDLYEQLDAARPGLEESWRRTLRLFPEGIDGELSVRVRSGEDELAHARFVADAPGALRIEVLDAD